MQTKIKVGIIGAAGYTGGELLRVLLRHPKANISFVHSTSNAGELVSKVHTDLLGDTDLIFAKEIKHIIIRSIWQYGARKAIIITLHLEDKRSPTVEYRKVVWNLPQE